MPTTNAAGQPMLYLGDVITRARNNGCEAEEQRVRRIHRQVVISKGNARHIVSATQTGLYPEREVNAAIEDVRIRDAGDELRSEVAYGGDGDGAAPTTGDPRKPVDLSAKSFSRDDTTLIKAPPGAKAIIYSVHLTAVQKRELEGLLSSLAVFADGGKLSTHLERVRWALQEARQVL